MMTTEPLVGLCTECAFRRVVENARGSQFWLCLRSRFDPHFPRYPRLPVLACPGFRAGAPPPQASSPPE